MTKFCFKSIRLYAIKKLATFPTKKQIAVIFVYIDEIFLNVQ